MAKIMIVEDSNLMTAVISNFVKKEGTFELLTAKNGEEAVAKYKESKPDLVFMDIKMPGMDGLTALELIRKYDPDAKVVMCTALKETEQEEKAKKLGAKGYIRKPFSRDDIATAIKNNIK
jgi:two-component system, chemotaxis family, chemotaxis protein CheY